MGYTHYWRLRNAIEQSDWNEFLNGARQIISTAVDAGLAIEDNSEGSVIYFNGVGGDAHEDFVISSEDVGFNFCKTARKPYDTVVTACLILLKATLKDNVIVTSDGNWSDWEGGSLLYETVFDKTAQPAFA